MTVIAKDAKGQETEFAVTGAVHTAESIKEHFARHVKGYTFVRVKDESTEEKKAE